MIDQLKLCAVVACEYFGWLTIVDQQIVSRYLASHRGIGASTESQRYKASLCKYRSQLIHHISHQAKYRIFVKPQLVKVLWALIISMTTGAIVLMFLGKSHPSTGVVPLSIYYPLDSIEKALYSNAPQAIGRWKHIEVFYSGTAAGNIEQLAQLSGLLTPEEINCHFVVCNGLGGSDGEIETTEKWLRQWSSIPDRTWYGSGQTIRICIIADSETARPTNFQIKRTEALVEALRRKFNIQPDYVYYPGNCR